MDVISHPSFATLHVPATRGNPEHPGRLLRLHERFPDDACVGEPAATDEIELSTRVDTSTRSRRSRRRCGSIRTRTRPQLPVRLRDSRPAVRSPRSRSGALRSCVHPATMCFSPRAMGFCIFGNVAIAARHAQRDLGIDRVAVIDFDVHHGNGTEALFRDDPSVLTVSLHQWPFWPGTGGPDANSEGVVNVPLAAGSGDVDTERLSSRQSNLQFVPSSPGSSSLPPASTRIGTTRWPRWR